MERNSSVSDALPDRELGHYPSKDLSIEKVDRIEKHGARPPPPQRSLARSIAIVSTCTLAMVINTSNGTSVSISLADIGKAIDIQEDQLQWLVTAYSLSSGCLLLLFGRLADLYGRKKGFLVGMLVQAIFSLGLGFSSNGITLDILRALQGMGAAAAIPSALGVLAYSFPPSPARSIAFATFAAGAPIGGALGNIIGGALTQLSSEHWRAPFYLTAALSALCALGCLISFDADRLSSEADTRIDWIGAMLVTVGLVLIVFVLGQGPIAGWNKAYIIVCLVFGVIITGLFVAWERHLENSAAVPSKSRSFWTPPPLMKPSIWARAKGRMAAILLIAFLNWSGFLSWTFWAQLYYQDYLGLTPVKTMVRFIPMFVMGLLCNFIVAMVIGRLPLVIFVVLGTLVTGFACVLFALINPSATWWAYGFPSTVMVVFGADFVYSAGTIFVAKIVLPHEQSLAGGLFQTMTQLGTAFGLTISTIVSNRVAAPGSLQTYTSAQWTSAAFPFLAGLLAVIFLRNVGVVGYGAHDEQDPSERTITEEDGIQV